MAIEVHCIAMKFDTQTGELLGVEPIEPPEEYVAEYNAKKGTITPIDDPKQGDAIIIANFRHSKLRLNSSAYEFGSPGCETYQTKAGPVRICW